MRKQLLAIDWGSIPGSAAKVESQFERETESRFRLSFVLILVQRCVRLDISKNESKKIPRTES